MSVSTNQFETFTAEEFQSRFDELFARVENGETLIITHEGERYVIMPFSEYSDLIGYTTEPMMPLIYLAAPYSHEDKVVIENRMAIVRYHAAQAIQNGQHVVSPLYCHSMVHCFDIPGDWTFWQHFSEALLIRCDKLRVLKLEGWETSAGVLAEIEFAQKNGIEIEYVNISPEEEQTAYSFDTMAKK